MPTRGHVAGAILLVVTACACSGGISDTAPQQNRGIPGAVPGGAISPPADDTSDQIVSWVDGQAVTDWAAEIPKRDQAIEQYLNDTDSARAEQYGFRSGQNPQLARSEEHTSELQSQSNLVCRLLLEKK